VTTLTAPARDPGAAAGADPGAGPKGRPARGRRAARSGRGLDRASGIGLGVAMVWMSLLVLIPLAAVIVKASEGGLDTYLETFTNEQTFAALKLTVLSSLACTALNMVMGTVIAWVLVRDRFWGKRVLDVIIDIPFALPTIVAGLVLLALYGPSSPIGVDVANSRVAVFLAIAFVTLPFVVRTVQPVLEDFDREVEEAAATLGARRRTTILRVVLPPLIPAILTGFALAFARAVGEYGSVIFIAGNIPRQTEILPLLIVFRLEERQYPEAAAIAAVMLTISFLILLLINLIQAWSNRRFGNG
jgi:sulfate transport system permease protein